MIYTRWGNEVKILTNSSISGIIHIEYQDVGKSWHGEIKDLTLGELKADGGIQEIRDAIYEANT